VLDVEGLLRALMEKHDWTVEELSEVIGDSPLRIYRVLEAEESLGKVARLAAIAVYNGFLPIE